MEPRDDRIDELYKGPLAGFVAARTSLAKTLTGDTARQVKALAKPTAVVWAVNQVYWHERRVYDRLVQAGEKLRRAQVAALGGRSADVSGASEAHRRVLADAVAAALQHADGAKLHVNRDALTRMLEAVSLASRTPEPPGRFTGLLQPAGFEALEGVAVKAKPVATGGRSAASGAQLHQSPQTGALRSSAEARRRAEELAAAERRKAKEIDEAERTVARAQEVEARAREGWERAKTQREEAERALASLRNGT